MEVPATRVGVRALRQRLAEHVRRAAGGESVVITVDGRPVARLGPLSPVVQLTLDDLVASGQLLAPSTTARPPAPAPVPLPVDLRLDEVIASLRGGPVTSRSEGGT